MDVLPGPTSGLHALRHALCAVRLTPTFTLVVKTETALRLLGCGNLYFNVRLSFTHAGWFDSRRFVTYTVVKPMNEIREGFYPMKTVLTEIPENLYKGAMALAKEGWFRDEKEVFSEAIRRFLESHQPELMDQYIREDVDWGLHGQD
jgi:hypothetical protein